MQNQESEKELQILTDKINKLLELQDNFNCVVDKNWKENRHIHDWAVAAFDECTEIINSLPWKWWKKMDTDLDNAQVEVVDILHFILAQVIQAGYSKLEPKNVLGFLVNYKKNSLKKYLKNDKITSEFIRNLVSYLNTIISIMYSINKNSSQSDIEELLATFATISAPFISYEDLIKLYIGKNALNKVRQDFGYKLGTYKKVWNGKEDNVIMQELLKKINFEDLSFENIYNKLEEYYTKNVEK